MSLLDALNFKSCVSVCKRYGKLLKTLAHWNAKVLRPVSVIIFELMDKIITRTAFTK